MDRRMITAAALGALCIAAAAGSMPARATGLIQAQSVRDEKNEGSPADMARDKAYLKHHPTDKALWQDFKADQQRQRIAYYRSLRQRHMRHYKHTHVVRAHVRPSFTMDRDRDHDHDVDHPMHPGNRGEWHGVKRGQAVEH